MRVIARTVLTRAPAHCAPAHCAPAHWAPALCGLVLCALVLAPAAAAIAQAAPAAPAADLVGQLTLEEKAALVTGRNAWETAEVPRLGIPPVWMADGPVGLRRSTGEAVTASQPATCFPSAAAMAATWDPELIEQVGAAIGAEARAAGVTLLLGPGLNMKRHPLGGRNFEYYSEDPLLSGRIAAAFVRGVQSQGVGATLKHFAVNNQEHRRMSIDARVGERALREIYLRGFEIAVEESAPQAVMSAYNKVNGTWASESRLLLTEILRDEWGFEGLVVSDWGAVDEPAPAIAAGLDLEMPGNPLSPPRVVQAVRDGELAEDDLDRAVGRVLQLVERQAAQTPGPGGDLFDAHHELARRVALEGLVLLRNNGILPVAAGPARRIGVVGRLAWEPRIQGVGSSQVNATRVDDAWGRIEELAAADGHAPALWRAEYDENGLTASETAELVSFLAERDLVLVFAGQKASHDAEAWDRPSMSLAPADLELLAAVAASGKPFVVVLVGGGAMDVRPFAAQAGAVLMGWLGGQGFGTAVADALFGRGAPAGKLSETFAWSVADHASAINFPGGPRTVDYGEGLFVGYRYFQTFRQAVAYPFGHGLSYGAIEIASATAPEALAAPAPFEVRVALRNAGERAGAETVQVYLRQLGSVAPPPRPRADRLWQGAAWPRRDGRGHDLDRPRAAGLLPRRPRPLGHRARRLRAAGRGVRGRHPRHPAAGAGRRHPAGRGLHHGPPHRRHLPRCAGQGGHRLHARAGRPRPDLAGRGGRLLRRHPRRTCRSRSWPPSPRGR